MKEADKNSDIDLFIITKKGNLWTARFIVTTLMTFLAVRRRNTHGLKKGTPEYILRTKDKFCLSFFITEEAVNLESIRLQPNDPYLDKWIRTLMPLVNKNTTYERFMRANGVEPVIATARHEAGGDPSLLHGSPRVSSTSSKTLGMTEAIFSLLSIFENLIKRLWLPHTLRTYEKLGRPWGVIISDTMLKFHNNDQRKAYRDT